MAASQSIIWTTLPYGRITMPDGKSALRVSIFVAPRLIPTAQQVLKPFPLFLDWPATVANLKFKLVFDSGGGGDLVPLKSEDALDSTPWKRMFAEDTFVRGAAFTDLKDQNIRSFPAADVLAYVEDLYGATAAQYGTDFPPHGPNSNSPLTKLKQDLGPLSNPDVKARYNKSLDAFLAKSKVAGKNLAGFSSPAQAAFFQAGRFYDRKKVAGANPYREQPDPNFARTPIAEPEFDFHQALAALADYPRLMRRLGLVIDCAWVETAVMPLIGKVRVEVASSDPAAAAILAPDKPGFTAYALDKAGPMFRARAVAGPDSELTRGVMDLRLATDAPANAQKSPYLIAQVDVDGSALKTMNTAGTLARLDNPDLTNYRSPTSSDLPALRTSGLSLYKRDRATATHAQHLRSANLQKAQVTTGRPDYFADDLMRGYRLDIWDDVSNGWHPLCLRNGDYYLSKRGKLQLSLRDEGYVKGSSATRGDPAVETDLYQHERLVSFDGWSLVATRPGKTLAADPTETEPVPPPESAATEFGLATKFAPPAGTVPRLRFGRNYKLRVRLVDLAGNSLDFDKAGDVYASPPFLFTRYEPVPSPAVLLRARVTEGESLEHLVIRSDFDRTTTAYAADAAVNAALEAVRDRLDLTGPARDGYVYLDLNERHIAPPKTSQLEAETHGRFDEYIGPGKDHAKGFRYAQRESGNFFSKEWVDTTTGATETIPGVDIEVVPPTGKDPTDLDDPKRLPGDALQQGEYVLHKEEQLTVPYLPDPFAASVAFVGLPGATSPDPVIVPIDGTWPEVRPFRIRLVERAGAMNQCDQIFTDSGAPSWDAEHRVLTVYQAKGVVSEVRYSSVFAADTDAMNMGMWKWLKQRGALTPAVQKQILAGGHWMFTPWRTLTLVHAVQHPLCPPTITIWGSSRATGNTFASLRGKWHLSIKSTAKVLIQATWQEPLDDVTKPAPQTLDRSGNVAELKMDPAASDDLEVPGPLNAILQTKATILHEFGDTKHRNINYRLKGTTRFREYFPVEITHEDAAITRVGPDFLLNVRSSARPASTVPLYILPTFRWEETALPNNGLSRIRRGNGLRVYLDRPWWSSGEDERLGVVFRPGPVSEADKPYVTQWGLDPVFDSPAPVTGPTLTSFPLAKETLNSLSLEEKGNTADVYSAAGHAVEFDPLRKLWFADITVSAGSSYFPFIRLAVARFQPSSIADCHLSRVVMTDFVQLVPDRTLKITWVTPTKVRVQIYGPAPTETYVSRVLKDWGITTTPAQTKSVTTPIADIVSNPPAGAQAMQYFKTGQLEFIQATNVGINPGIFVQVADPADPSSRAGLNEYSVTLERLPDGESPDFGWQAVDGVIPTKVPAATTSSPATIGVGAATVATRAALPATTTVAVKTAAATKATATKAASAASTAKVASAAAAKAAATSAADQLQQVVVVGPILELKPLWEGDISLPASNDNRPRRLVVRENELYFKSLNSPNDFLPIARRLVYVDIVALPGPTS